MSVFRKHGRTLVKCAVKLSHEQFGDLVAETRDISESGVFVQCQGIEDSLTVGDRVEAELFYDIDAVSQAFLTVIRLTDEGIGLAFS